MTTVAGVSRVSISGVAQALQLLTTAKKNRWVTTMMASCRTSPATHPLPYMLSHGPLMCAWLSTVPPAGGPLRSSHQTAMNENSSRSHCVMRLSLVGTHVSGTKLTGSLNMVDLAGRWVLSILHHFAIDFEVNKKRTSAFQVLHCHHRRLAVRGLTAVRWLGSARPRPAPSTSPSGLCGEYLGRCRPSRNTSPIGTPNSPTCCR